MNLNKWTELTEEELMNTAGGSITIATVGAGLAIFLGKKCNGSLFNYFWSALYIGGFTCNHL